MTTLRKLSDRLAAPYWAYNLIQTAAGFRQLAAWARPVLARTAGHSVLDVGGGTGLWGQMLPPDVRQYTCLDIDPEKLLGLRKRIPRAHRLLGDATAMGVADRSFDYAICMCVAHHLTDEQLPRMLAEIARVVRRGMIFLDPLRCEAPISRLLWSADRGSHPRTRSELLDHIGRSFTITDDLGTAVLHRYLLCVTKPKEGRT